MKISISLLSKLNVCLITPANGTLIISFSKEEIILAQDTLLYHLESLQFFINIKKMVLQPTKLIEFLDIKINSVKMTLQLPPKKTDESVTQCRTFLKRFFIIVRELTQLVGCLSLTAVAILRHLFIGLLHLSIYQFLCQCFVGLAPTPIGNNSSK